MGPEEALREAKGYAGANRIRIGAHARLRMRERGAQVGDLRRALMTAASAKASPDGPGRWIIQGGVDLDDEELTLVVVFEDECVVVTLF